MKYMKGFLRIVGGAMQGVIALTCRPGFVLLSNLEVDEINEYRAKQV
jgi:hypothetical protein